MNPYQSISTLYIVTSSVFHDVQSALFSSNKIKSTGHLGRVSLHARHAGHAIACATSQQWKYSSLFNWQRLPDDLSTFSLSCPTASGCSDTSDASVSMPWGAAKPCIVGSLTCHPATQELKHRYIELHCHISSRLNVQNIPESGTREVIKWWISDMAIRYLRYFDILVLQCQWSKSWGEYGKHCGKLILKCPEAYMAHVSVC